MVSQPASPDMLIVVIQLNWQGQTSPIECGGLGGCGVGGCLGGGGWLVGQLPVDPDDYGRCHHILLE